MAATSGPTLHWHNDCPGCNNQADITAITHREHAAGKCCLKCRNFRLAEVAAKACDEQRYRAIFDANYSPETTEAHVVNGYQCIFVKQARRKQEDSFILDVAAEIASTLPTRTDKAYALFYWLANNICFDTSQMARNEVEVIKTEEQVLKDRAGVCRHYVRLFKKMWETLMPVDTGFQYISGLTDRKLLPRPVPGQTNFVWNGLTDEQKRKVGSHAWNSLILDEPCPPGVPKLMDASWAATRSIRHDGSMISKPYNSSMFTMSNHFEVFNSHFPSDKEDDTSPSNKIYPEVPGASSTYEYWWNQGALPQESAESHIVDMETVKPELLDIQLADRADTTTKVNFFVQLACKHWRLPTTQSFALCLMPDVKDTIQFWFPFTQIAGQERPTWTCTLPANSDFNAMRSAFIYLIRILPNGNQWKTYREADDTRIIPWSVRWRMRPPLAAAPPQASKPLPASTPTRATPTTPTKAADAVWGGYKIPKKTAGNPATDAPAANTTTSSTPQQTPSSNMNPTPRPPQTQASITGAKRLSEDPALTQGGKKLAATTQPPAPAPASANPPAATPVVPVVNPPTAKPAPNTKPPPPQK